MAINVARPNQLGEIYDNVLARSFPPAELVDRQGFLTHTTWGEVLVAGEDQIEGVAVGDHSAATSLMMVDYLAMAPESRQGGQGTELFAAARERWIELVHPGAFLAELERPDAHPASEQYGDPGRRLQFYQRLGVRALAVPYYQPAVAPGQPPVPDLLLAILVEDPAWVVGDLFVQGERVAALIGERNPSPTEAELPAHEALLAALRDPAGVELVDLDDYQGIPRSGPVG